MYSLKVIQKDKKYEYTSDELVGEFESYLDIGSFLNQMRKYFRIDKIVIEPVVKEGTEEAEQ